MQEKVKNQKLQIDEKRKTFDKTENYLKNIESIGQLVGEVIQKLTEDKIMVKAASGPRYIVGCRPKIDKSKLKGPLFLDVCGCVCYHGSPFIILNADGSPCGGLPRNQELFPGIQIDNQGYVDIKNSPLIKELIII